MVDVVDQQVGRLVSILDEEKIAGETIVMLCSDNGGSIGASNGTLRLGKTTVFEGGIRVPAAIHYPGVIEGGKTIGQMVTMHDLFPTLAAACGVKPRNRKPFYGSNLWANFRSGKISPPKNMIIGSGGSFAVFDGDWKYVSQQGRGAEAEAALFRIREDPEEKHDLLAKHPEVGKRMAEAMARLEVHEPLSAGPAAGGGGGDGSKKGGGKKKGGKKKGAAAAPGGETRPPVAEAATDS
jgi:arylsulfatase A-like enzyme